MNNIALGNIKFDYETRCPECNILIAVGHKKMQRTKKEHCKVCNPYIEAKCDLCNIETEILSSGYWKCPCGGNYQLNKKESNV